MKYLGNKDENIKYTKRPGAYAIIINDSQEEVGIVTDAKDYFYLGGGIEEGESELDALKRELIEEARYTLKNATSEELEEAYKLSGSVILHKLEARDFGKTIREVTYAFHLYDIVLDSEFMANPETPPEVYEWAEELLKYGPQGPEGLVFEHWHKTMPYEPYCEVCGIYFYEEERITKKVTGGKVS